jgi:hypothetical protein
VTRRIAALLTALALLALGPADVSADHGYWPAGGVDPAPVAGHREVTDEATLASAWGDDCTALDTVAPRRDVYGVVLDADYRLAVILAGSGSTDAWLAGPFGATLFEAPRAGQFLWADADGDSRYAARHEADARLLIVCPGFGLPATSTVESRGGAQPSVGWPWVLPVALVAFVGVLLRTPREVDRRPSGGR